MSGKRFGLVSIDYPMEFETYSLNGRGKTPDRHYDIMAFNQYDRLQRALMDITTPDCIFLHWVWSPTKVDFAGMVKDWENEIGISYRSTLFVWVKLNPRYPVGQMTLTPDATDPTILNNGTGYYTRQQVEEVWLLRNAKMPAPDRANRSVKQTIITPVSAHSEKPDEYFNRVQMLYGNIDCKLECFARKPRAGWVCWGNEINGRDIFDEIADYKKGL